MSKKGVIIVDYGMGNLFSVVQACKHVGLDAKISSDKEEIRNAESIILPGVGAFGGAMRQLEQLNLVEVLIDYANSNKPFLGICLGMQLLMTSSEEFGFHKGLDIVEGKVLPFSNLVDTTKNKVPQIQWNKIEVCSREAKLTENIENGAYMYFLHSFYIEPEDNNIITTLTEYGSKTYCSSFQKGNIFGTQFHPEKSSLQGLNMLSNFKKIVNNE
ncbi:imidazole glycerol phosphate synthase subunit HisH [Lacihabitans sp. CCS-44]|uniref:imidazole glycerol phosphate synthase subunit HisH n=1 Tax=Lacihabitans sp. CCS-44 TaxID=2487331 RepID=UPI0020CEB848|nr:imidazole glycerol phosphate synthase subunit HisH [Lacihabitans sp. CCS-44]MCP9754979.1 imidazole glycerol phosphate synthase subunit HisH [Lacihabitans sp. CCS-44]